MRLFIKSERTGGLEFAKALRNMLPYIAAAGHHLYAKPLHLHLQRRLTLPVQRPEVYKVFKDGHHVVRRSDMFWVRVIIRFGDTTGLRDQAAVFKSDKSHKDDVIKADEKATVCPYGRGTTETLNSLRLRLFHKKVSSSSSHVYNPTVASARYHRLRVFHQVPQWLVRDLPP